MCIRDSIYYQPKSLKSKLCVEGNKLLYEYAKKFNVPHVNTKKIIVANNDLQMHQVQQIKVQAETNGVENLEVIDEKQVNQLEPLIKSTGGLLVSSTGVIDQHTLMQSYLGEFENNGGMISYNSNVKKISIVKNKFEIEVVDNENATEVANPYEELNLGMTEGDRPRKRTLNDEIWDGFVEFRGSAPVDDKVIGDWLKNIPRLVKIFKSKEVDPYQFKLLTMTACAAYVTKFGDLPLNPRTLADNWENMLDIFGRPCALYLGDHARYIWETLPAIFGRP